MPDLTFFLPHWIYWMSLIVIPLLCMIVIRKQMGEVKEGPAFVRNRLKV